jgi:hypothetical protein
MRLGHSDYEAGLSLVAEAADTSGVQPFELSTIERLLRVIPAERAGYYEYHGGGQAYGIPNTFFVDSPSLREDLDWSSDLVHETAPSWPLHDSCVVAAYDTPLMLSDFLTGARLRRNPWYSEIMRPSGIEHELKVWLPAPTDTYRGASSFCVARDSATSTSGTAPSCRSSGRISCASAHAGSGVIDPRC